MRSAKIYKIAKFAMMNFSLNQEVPDKKLIIKRGGDCSIFCFTMFERKFFKTIEGFSKFKDLTFVFGRGQGFLK